MNKYEQFFSMLDEERAHLWNALSLMLDTFERPIGMYANERKACDIARIALHRYAAPVSEAPTDVAAMECHGQGKVIVVASDIVESGVGSFLKSPEGKAALAAYKRCSV